MKSLMINWGLLLNYLINYWKARIMLYDVIWSGYGSTLVDTKIGGIWMFIPPKYINILVLDGSGTSPIIPIYLMTWELFQGKKSTMQEAIYEGKHKWVNTDTVHRNPRISRSTHPPHRFQSWYMNTYEYSSSTKLQCMLRNFGYSAGCNWISSCSRAKCEECRGITLIIWPVDRWLPIYLYIYI